MTHVTRAMAIFLFAVSITFYQNCGSGTFKSKSASNRVDDQSLPSTDPLDYQDIPQQAKNFKAGDPFNYAYVPYHSQLVTALVTQYNFANHDGNRALAIAANGLGYASYGRYGTALNEVRKQALESCNLISGMPCVVVAENNIFATSLANLDAEMLWALPAKNADFEPAQMPVVGPSRNNENLVAYKNAANAAKAIAISPSGFYTYYAPADDMGYTQEDVNRRVLQHCELSAALTPCVLYAVDNKVVLDTASWARMSNIDYTITDLMSVPPYAAAETYLTELQSDYIPQLSTLKGAIYISRNGILRYAANANLETAKSAAKASCVEKSGADTCFLYAVDKTITFKSTQTLANSQFSNLFCLMPRTSCAEHAQVGCAASGDYWVLDGAATKTTSCNMSSLTP